jgi:hypothetical protein
MALRSLSKSSGPLLAAWRQLREQIAMFDKVVLQQVRADPICRLLMTVPGIGALSSLAYERTAGPDGMRDPLPNGYAGVACEDQRNGCPDRHTLCRITANLRASATRALPGPERCSIASAQAFRCSGRFTR